MAGTAFKSVDKQRFKKIYPAKRHAPVLVKQTNKGLTLESTSLEFTESSGTTSKTYTFTQAFLALPNVTHGIRSTNGDMVLVKITALSKTAVTIEVSAAFDGSIDLQIVEIES